MVIARAAVRAVLIGVAVVGVAGPAVAQGRGGPPPDTGPGAGHPGGGPTLTQASTPTPSSVTLASWISDASTAGRGQSSLAISMAHWRSSAGRDIEAPIIDLTTGVTPRLDLGASLPVYHYEDVSGASASGVRQVRIYAKLGLLAPDTHRVGFAFSPVMQVQSSSLAGDRVGVVLPLSAETRVGRTREYGSIGYSSSGAVFATGAVEVPMSERLIGSLTLAHSRATRTSALDAGQRPNRTDLSLAAAFRIASALAVYGATGHAFSGDPALDGGVWVAGGVIVQMKRR
jgi:hypothetical protein